MSIQYTSRTFNTALTDINSDSELAPTPNWWKRALAGVVDVNSLWLNATANDLYISSCFTYRSMVELCKLIDYDLTPATTSNGDIIFYLDPATTTFPITFTTTDMIANSEGNLSVSSKRFESIASKTLTSLFSENPTHSAGTWTVTRSYTTGEMVRVDSSGTLPTPLTNTTNYYIIRVDATHVKLATSLVNAINGTYISSTGGTGTYIMYLWCFTQTLYQQTSLAANVSIGQSDGSTQWQKFDLPDLSIIKPTITIIINSVTWTAVDTLVDSISTDTHYKIYYRSDGTCYVQFGDGTYGAIPGNFTIYANYKTGGGVNSNVNAINKINLYAGSSSYITGVTNPAVVTGGADAENIESARIIAPLVLKATNRAVTEADFVALSLAYGGVQRVRCNSNQYGLGSCQIVIVPTGGGTSSSGFKTALKGYLLDRTLLSTATTPTVDVRVFDATYNTVAVTGTVKILTAYTWATIQNYVILGLRLLFTEIGYELYNDYKSNGIAYAIEIINAKWSTSFGISDYNAIIRLLDNLPINDIGKDFNQSDVLGYIDSYVTGVDYWTISSPSFPITQATNEITTAGTMTITQIP